MSFDRIAIVSRSLTQTGRDNYDKVFSGNEDNQNISTDSTPEIEQLKQEYDRA